MHTHLSEVDNGGGFYVGILVDRQFALLQIECMWGVHDNLLSNNTPR